MKIHACTLALALTAAGCGDTGQGRIELPLHARGVAGEPFEVDGFEVTLHIARVGIGPIYACASARSSSDLCPTAVAEFASSASVDALDPSLQRLGTLDALTASARSMGLDYAITWPTSAAGAVILKDAPGGHSAEFDGHAERADRAFDFHAALDIAPTLRGTRVIQGLATRAALAAGLECELDVDPIAWWSQVDFEALAALPGDAIDVAADSMTAETLRAAMTSNATPVFSWRRRE